MEYDRDEDVEIRYKIRSIIHRLGEQADMIANLRDQLEQCLEKKSDLKRYRNCLGMIDSMVDISKNTHDQMAQLLKLMEEYREKS